MLEIWPWPEWRIVAGKKMWCPQKYLVKEVTSLNTMKLAVLLWERFWHLKMVLIMLYGWLGVILTHWEGWHSLQPCCIPNAWSFLQPLAQLLQDLLQPGLPAIPALIVSPLVQPSAPVLISNAGTAIPFDPHCEHLPVSSSLLWHGWLMSTKTSLSLPWCS